MSRPLSLVLAVLMAGSLGAQTPAVRPGANVVRVDMYAMRDGQPLADLTADEVEILEDGTPQTIESFERVAIPGADGRRSRVFVIFLDTVNSEAASVERLRLPLLRFLDRLVADEDLVAIMTPEMLARDLQFGKKAAVVASVMRDETWGRRGQDALDQKDQLYRNCYPDSGNTKGFAREMSDRRREDMALGALDDLVGHLREVREERKTVLTISEGWPLVSIDRRLAAAATERPPASRPSPFGGRGRDTGERDRSTTGVMMRECEADRLRLAMLDDRMRLRGIGEDANRGNVSFYPVPASALGPADAARAGDRTATPAIDASTLAARQDSLKQLVGDTDGAVVTNTDASDNISKRIVDDASSYYLVRYTSTNTKLDGRFRSITVRVKRAGAQVRARRGYRGLTTDDLLAIADEGRRADAAANAAVVNPREQFRLWTAAWTMPQGPPAIWIVGELDYATRRELAWSAGATADIAVVGGDGKDVVATSVELPPGDGTFSLRLPDSTALTAGEYAVRVRVRPGADPALPVTSSAKLAVPASASVLGEAVMWRRGPSTGLKYLATADPRFQRSERIRFELPTSTAGAATARMLDRAGNLIRVPVQVSERADASGMFRWIVADATLAPLAAGDYSIEVTLAGTKEVAPFKVVP